MKMLLNTITACALSLALGLPAFAETPAPASKPAPVTSVAPVKADATKAVPAKSGKKHRKSVKTTGSTTSPAPAAH